MKQFTQNKKDIKKLERYKFKSYLFEKFNIHLSLFAIALLIMKIFSKKEMPLVDMLPYFVILIIGIAFCRYQEYSLNKTKYKKLETATSNDDLIQCIYCGGNSITEKKSPISFKKIYRCSNCQKKLFVKSRINI